MNKDKIKRMYEMECQEDPTLTKGMKRIYFIFFVLILCSAIGVLASIITKTNDGPIEQTAEAVIKAETGIDIDLTS